MFEVLAFVFENYWSVEACPALPALQRKLNAVGFDDDEIQEALVWLEDLKSAARNLPAPYAEFAEPASCVQPAESAEPAARAALADAPGDRAHAVDVHMAAATHTPNAMRVFTQPELACLGCDGWGLLTFLVSVGALPWHRLELVMDRVMATPAAELSVDDLKLIVLMVFWSLDEEPDALVLDELCDNTADRVGH